MAKGMVDMVATASTFPLGSEDPQLVSPPARLAHVNTPSVELVATRMRQAQDEATEARPHRSSPIDPEEEDDALVNGFF